MSTDFLAEFLVSFCEVVVSFVFQVRKLLARCVPNAVKRKVKQHLKTKGVTIGGDQPWDLQVRDEQFYWHVAARGSLGFGESYVNGWFECENLQELCVRVVCPNNMRRKIPLFDRFLDYLLNRFLNVQTKKRSKQVANKHYNIGNDLYEIMLDPTLNYSCGYWRSAKNQREAQIAKMDLIAQKLKLKPGMKVLDIGSGWGSLANYLAKHYDVEVIGYNISDEQIKYSRDLCKNLKVEIRKADYRDIEEKFDRIVSVGMFEHVGDHNYRTFFEICHRCLIDEGIFLLHTIGINHDDTPRTDPFICRYIFPNSALPTCTDITAYSKGLFIIEDWHNFSFDYSKTLNDWYQNLLRGWPRIAEKYGETFFRLWTYYLCISYASFVRRRTQLWQITFSKYGLLNGYESVR